LQEEGWLVLRFWNTEVYEELDAVLEAILPGLRSAKVPSPSPPTPHPPSTGEREQRANHLGRRFLAAAERLSGPLEVLSEGVWANKCLQRPLLLVSNRQVPVDRESLPVHLLTVEGLPHQREVAGRAARAAGVGGAAIPLGWGGCIRNS